ncbi:unnamed protein product [Phaedon cochleariae]|uniref:MADF domain-containing protein n=1 Tax=Phaedon cochleariae TaxID=80249 RepID=A0A9N9SL51_PHACE|nr:unnamed protein product [Phaedon cochleariae]
MTDTRYFSKDFMTEFIRVYREHTSLWKIKSKAYMNKNLKNVGITQLIEVCKQFQIMEADKNFVMKKIQSIRGSFRKELKKIEDSQRSGASADDIYQPTLWYFQLLQFTIDQETATDSISNMESSTSEVGDSCEERQDQQSNNAAQIEGENSKSWTSRRRPFIPKKKCSSSASAKFEIIAEKKCELLEIETQIAIEKREQNKIEDEMRLRLMILREEEQIMKNELLKYELNKVRSLEDSN